MRILIAENDRRLAQAMARGLRGHGYAVDVAADGEAALYYARVYTYDAVVLDAALPKRDGFAVCTELRRRGVEARVLMLTARDAVHDCLRGPEPGADDYLAKPVDPDALPARLRALLRLPGQVRAETVRVGDLEVDTGARRARRAGRLLPLTGKEYVLLEYLARNAGRVVTRAEIADHAWEGEYDPLSNLVEVYMSRLRRKLDGGAPARLLHTRRGAGYLLGAQDDETPAAAGAMAGAFA